MLFGPPPVKTTLLVDITSSSVGAAYLSSKKGDAPVLVHAVREGAQGEGTTAMLRTLDIALSRLQKEGGPKRHLLIGSTGVEGAVVCVGAPWQESEVKTNTVEKDKPFTFTKAMLETALHEEGGRSLHIASLLNGYVVADPVGKRIKRADTVVLRAKIVPELYDTIKRTVRSAAGGHEVRMVAFGEVAQGVLSAAFPQERDYLAIRVGQDATETAFVRRGMLSGVRSCATGTRLFHEAARSGGVSAAAILKDDVIDRDRSAKLSSRMDAAQQEWASALRECLANLTSGAALPRSVYLFAEEDAAPFLKRLFDDPALHVLWLSDEPLSLIEVRGGVFDAYLHRTQDGSDDAFLDALALLVRK